MARLSVILFLCVLCEAAFATAAYAQSSISGCKKDLVESMSNVRFNENQITLTGTAARPVQIDCDDLQLFANTVELFNEEGRFIAYGDVLFVSGTNRISA